MRSPFRWFIRIDLRAVMPLHPRMLIQSVHGRTGQLSAEAYGFPRAAEAPRRRSLRSRLWRFLHPTAKPEDGPPGGAAWVFADSSARIMSAERCAYFSRVPCDRAFKYAFMKPSSSPSITAVILPISKPVRWSFTRVYGMNT